jgi:hypothetical protein
MKPLGHYPSLSSNPSGARPHQRPPRNAAFPSTVSAKKIKKISSTIRKRFHDIDTIGIVPRRHLATGTLGFLIHKRHLTSTDVPHECMPRNWERLKAKYGEPTFLFSGRVG